MQKRRSNGEGTVYRDAARNRWVGQLSVRGADGRTRRRKVYGKTQAEARRKLHELRRQIEAGAVNLDRTMTVERLGEYWINEVLPHRDLRDRTKTDYTYTSRHYVYPIWGRTRLCDLRTSDVEAGLGKLAKQGYKKDTIRLVRSALNQIVHEAVREQLIASNPVAAARRPKAPVLRERRAMTEAQVHDLLAEAEGTRAFGPILLALTSGMRPGEVLDLKWETVDLTAAQPSLRITEAKTARGRRTIPLHPEVVSMLREQRKANAEASLAASSLWNELGYVFPSSTGTKWDLNNFRKLFKDLCRNAGIGEWSPHEMRHTAATWLLGKKVSPVVVADQLGHSSVTVTHGIYGHVIPPADEVLEAFGALLPVPAVAN